MASVNPQWELEDIEEALRSRFLESPPPHSPFIVRLLGTTGEVGKRCLTFHVEVRESEFHKDKTFLDHLVNDLRRFDWEIDELRQPVTTPDGWDARLWLMIYEEKKYHVAAEEAVK